MSYDEVAAEYYDNAHVTSRNFDDVTTAAVAGWAARLPSGLVLEPGCGRGRVGEFLGVEGDRVVQLDSSPAMLALTDREPCMLRVLHEAEDLPFSAGEFSSVVAFLCDGFFGLGFLAEAHRVLRSGGVLCGTIPAQEWAVALRELIAIDVMSTRFIIRSGERVTVPSFAYPEEQVGQMLRAAGFSAEVAVRRHTLPRNVAEISEDIRRPAECLGVDPHDLPVLYSFWAAA